MSSDIDAVAIPRREEASVTLGARRLSRPAAAGSQPGSASLTQTRSGATDSKPSRSNAGASASSS